MRIDISSVRSGNIYEELDLELLGSLRVWIPCGTPRAPLIICLKSETLTSEDHIFQISRGSQSMMGVHRYIVVQLGK